MKTCGYCNNQYNDAEPKCPVCGSTLLKYSNVSDPAEAELNRIKEEIKKKRKTKTIILSVGAGVIALVILIAVIGIVSCATDPQRDINSEAEDKFAQAEQQMENHDYEGALDTLDGINHQWDDYGEAEQLRLEAVRSQLTEKIGEYQASGNYEALITFIKNNVSDVNSDAEIKTAYDDAVKQYVSDALAKADTHIANAEYSKAQTVLNSAIAVVGENMEIYAKLSEIENAELQATIQGYEENGDYVGLVSYLEEVCSRNYNYYDLYEQYYQKLMDSILDEAQALADQRQFEEAISVLEDAQYDYYDERFEAKIEEYRECMPIDLADCHVIEINDGYYEKIKVGETCEDVFGNTYENAVYWTGGYTEEGFVTFFPNKKYNTLSGTIAPRNCDSNIAGYIAILVNGKEAYRTPEFILTTEPFTFSVDIQNCSQLTVEFYQLEGSKANWGPDHWGAVVSATLG